MLFTLTPEKKSFIKYAREFAEKEIKPLAAEFDEKEEFPREILPKLYNAGFLHMVMPEKYGGQGADLLSAVMVLEELAAADAGIALTLVVTTALLPLNNLGTEEQKEAFLSPFCRQAAVAGICISEPETGSDFSSLSCSARLEDDHYVINGTKQFVTNGGIADYYVVFATVDKSLKRKGICVFVVPKDAAGLTVGKKEKKLGFRTSPTTELHLNHVRVPKLNMIGKEGEGYQYALNFFNYSRPEIAAIGVGIARAAMEAAVVYANQRTQGGKPIAQHQAIQIMLANMATQIDAARLLTWRAASLLDQGNPSPMQSSMAKLFAAEACMKATMDAVQVFGGYGYMKDYPVEKYFRDAKLMEIFEGTSQIQQQIIAHEMSKQQGRK